MRQEYRGWLIRLGYDEGTVNAQLYRVKRVENYYGSLDKLYNIDKLEDIISHFRYSSEDERRGKLNHSSIPINVNIKNNLACYRSAIYFYRRFCAHDTTHMLSDVASNQAHAPTYVSQKLRVRSPSRNAISADARTLTDFNLDGGAALASLVAASQYRTVAQAVASLTLFSHPVTVCQTGCKAIFHTIRDQRRVGQIEDHQGRMVLLDDNKSPTNAFLWSNDLTQRGNDNQFNHIYAASRDIDAYTALPNICMTPAFFGQVDRYK